MSLWQRLRQGVDHLSGRYQAFEVHGDAERAEALALLDEVRRVELNRVHGRSALDSAAFGGAAVEDLLFGCRDTRTGQLVGCVRSTGAEQLAHIAASRAEYALDLFPAALLPRVGVATRLAVHRDARGSVSSLVLIEHVYAEGLRRGFVACLLTCEPGLYAMYLRLGFRPYARVHASPTGGWRVPMALPLHDLAHLERIGSPLARVLQRFPGRRAEGDVDEGMAWFHTIGHIEPGIAAFDDAEHDDVHHALTAGVSAAGRRQLFEHAHEVVCASGQQVVREGDGGTGIAFVLAGLVEVRRGGATLAMLGAGELFGEIGTVLGSYRTADVVAATGDTRVLVLSRQAIDRVTDPADRECLWRNLAVQVARRLVAAERR